MTWFAEQHDTWDVAWPMRCVVCGSAADYESRARVQTHDPKVFGPMVIRFLLCERHKDVSTDEAVVRMGIKTWNNKSNDTE